jgi:uridine phosphorylase
MTAILPSMVNHHRSYEVRVRATAGQRQWRSAGVAAVSEVRVWAAAGQRQWRSAGIATVSEVRVWATAGQRQRGSAGVAAVSEVRVWAAAGQRQWRSAGVAAIDKESLGICTLIHQKGGRLGSANLAHVQPVGIGAHAGAKRT